MNATRFVQRALAALALALVCLASGIGFQAIGVAAEPEVFTKTEKFTFYLFWRENNPATQDMAAMLNAALADRTDQAQSVIANVNDPAQQELVAQYRVSRAPMPMVLCVAPNGAITGAFPKRVTAQALTESIVSPAMADCVKLLQAEKIVVVHVKKDPQAPLPAGASQFIADPDFQARTAAISVVGYDPAEGNFLNGLEIDPASAGGSIVAIVAPPGTVVGRFTERASKEEIAAALHAAGKCCNDPNCKHNKPR